MRDCAQPTPRPLLAPHTSAHLPAIPISMRISPSVAELQSKQSSPSAMRKSSAILLASCALACVATTAFAQQGFKFSNPSPDEQAQAAAKADKQQQVDWQLSPPCRDRIKNRKIV